MKSGKRGKADTVAEVTQISIHGIWLLLPTGEEFLPFEHFPWFRDATIAQIQNVQLLNPQHLYWPDLDVDIHVESIHHPERFPLIMHGKQDLPTPRPAGAGRVSDKERSERRTPKRRS